MVCRLFVAQHMSRLETFSVTGILFSCIIAIAYIIYARAIKTQEDFVYFYDSNLKLVKELENLKSKLSDAELNLSQLRGELD
ncbi:MAG: hypothetical protein EBU90_01470 [Proteobacteria bacterium]|nr:hypothetical protein [Pseudomonadota bacterium]